VKKTVYWIEGDGVGPECWNAARPVFDAAVRLAYPGCGIDWIEVLAGEKAMAACGELLPEASIALLRGRGSGPGSEMATAIKGPLGTPVGTGFRSLNVTLRRLFDLYACIRPVRHVPGIESPLKRPDLVDMVVVRENTEDVYAGIEYASGSPEARKLIAFLREELGADVNQTAAVGLKPMTPEGCKRLVRRAIRLALDEGRPSVTLVHKGNIMKFTEGGFREWGYEVAREEFGSETLTEAEAKKGGQGGKGRVIVKDRIADAMFQDVLVKPQDFSVIATPNLNGDYLSDALAAQVGGLGLAPGANLSDVLGFFEATHGTAPDIAGQDRVNPGSLMLSGAMMLEYMGWPEAGNRVRAAVARAVAGGRVTADLARQMPGARVVGCKEFGEIVGAAL
jgi:isocitrate dehydrogenase